MNKRALGGQAQRERRAARRAQFLELYDFSQGTGLEVGPLDAGVADETIDDVRYVDVFDQDGIRDHYREDASVVLELVPHIDFPLYLDGEVRTLAEAAAPGGPYDWVIASHVIEHVPDLIGWLRQLAVVTADGARLLLAVPDRRYCFDLHRPPTTVGQILTAYEEKHTAPSVRAVYDFFSSVVGVDTAALWRQRRPAGRASRIHDRSYTMRQVERARAGEYVDCHVWTFTPQAFAEQIKELRGLGLCDWYVERLEPVIGSVEFLAVLRRIPDGADPAVPLPEVESDADLPDWLLDTWTARERAQVLRRKVRALKQRNRVLADTVADLESSARMRVGTVLVAPLSGLRRRLRRPHDRERAGASNG
ncbi:Methyltransferase domain-containing protein [Nocardioides terrae]|uniref:Methyltransferase domain-containing protein n=1 Tax=Nocardioides terrae TaxID=574651 RepID=A0A1I1IZN1_9ACTN|nr:methyltransferase domain-containing protein [Nocardioides terrae]SFC38680.1 Methyltransferase domain-containing protein [Nocardioides terrae]